MHLDIALNRSNRTPLPLQIARGLREALLSGRLRPGDRLPSSRELADHLAVARMVVVGAYERLATEGYVETRRGAGTFVPPHLVLPAASRRSRKVPEQRTDLPPTGPVAVDFRPSLPALDQFPRRAWRAALGRTLTRADPAALGYAPVEGSPRLRNAIAEYVSRVRGTTYAPERVVVTAGAAQAVTLVMRALGHGITVAIEDPSPIPFRRMVALNGGDFLPVPVDEHGMVVDALPSGREGLRMVYVIPSHQYPTGVVMSLERRLALIQWASRQNAYILEDDYDSEFRFDGAPPSALAALDRDADRVVYVGTFSKTMFPALRIGYLIAPESLIEPILEHKWWTDRCGPHIAQEALAAWLEHGLFERHVHRARNLYALRRTVLEEQLAAKFGSAVTLHGAAAGMHVMATFDTPTPEPEIVRRALDKEIVVYPVAPCRLRTKSPKPSLILGFGNVPPKSIRHGISVLRTCMSLR